MELKKAIIAAIGDESLNVREIYARVSGKTVDPPKPAPKPAPIPEPEPTPIPEPGPAPTPEPIPEPPAPEPVPTPEPAPTPEPIPDVPKAEIPAADTPEPTEKRRGRRPKDLKNAKAPAGVFEETGVTKADVRDALREMVADGWLSYSYANACGTYSVTELGKSMA